MGPGWGVNESQYSEISYGLGDILVDSSVVRVEAGAQALKSFLALMLVIVDVSKDDSEGRCFELRTTVTAVMGRPAYWPASMNEVNTSARYLPSRNMQAPAAPVTNPKRTLYRPIPDSEIVP